MKYRVTTLLFVIACLVLFSSCGEKTEKEKLIDALEKYVEELSPIEFEEQFVEFRSPSEIPEKGSKFEIAPSSLKLKENIDVSYLKAITEAEQNQKLSGKVIMMTEAEGKCLFEHKRRGKWRNEPKDYELEESVYFSIDSIQKWLDLVDSVYNTNTSGFRAYFSGYDKDEYIYSEPDKDGYIDSTNLKGRSSIVLRAMYLRKDGTKPDSIIKVKLIENKVKDQNNGIDYDILTFNLGGLCPPDCEDDKSIR